MPSLKRFLKRQNIIKTEDPVEQESLVLDEEVQEKEDQLLMNVTNEKTKTEKLSTKLKSVFGFSKKELTVEEHMAKLEQMTKLELDEYAEQYDIYLDRRRTKENMINEFIQKLKETN